MNVSAASSINAIFCVHLYLTFLQNAVLIDDGRNALLAAAEYNAHEALNLLIRSGADTTVRDKSGRDYHDLLALPWPRDDDE